MITEEEARAAAKQVPAIALVDMSPPVREVVMWATCELARREAERFERAEPIDAEWLESLENWSRTGEYISTRIKGNDVWYHIADACIGLGGLRQGHITTRGQLLDLLKALKGGE